LTIISLPLTVLTLGLFLFVVNGITVEITAFLSALNVSTFGAAMKAGIIITLANWLLNNVFKLDH